jgi:cyclase
MADSRPRLIPVLLLDRRKRLVKTVAFGERTYIGDPFNVLRIFNEKEVDEIVVLDIDATPDGRGPDLGFIGELASECFMPLAYGGGLTTAAQCEALNRAGVEKFVIGAAASAPPFIAELARTFGSQAIVGCVDVRGRGTAAAVVTRSGRERQPLGVADYALQLQQAGAGEVLLQSVDFDGARTGYDLELIRDIAARLSVPLIALGGAGEVAHLGAALAAGASAAASGSAFCFIGRRRAVLVTYPTGREVTDAALAASTGSSGTGGGARP